MKSMKFDHELAEAVLRGEKSSTWRVRDDKSLSVNDEVRLIDKVDPKRPETWRVFGVARIERVIEKRLGEVSPADFENHESYGSIDEMLTTFRSYYGNDVNLSTPIKFIHFTLLPAETLDNVNPTTGDITEVIIYADGGSRGNPGPSASGFVIINPATDSVLVDKGIYLGITTNNQAEYLALKYALEESQRMGIKIVVAYMDSMLVVNQLKGIFKVRNRDLWPIHESVKQLIAGFEKFTITHVPREMNRLADAAVNRAMDEALGTDKIQG
ncbi:MAG TPA: reverse transcriptase-like protein [Candidatus Saccharimonadales bacterium]|nr:reverse transcriptase-like protein [Candidatus Saccharimonadales bacterium]